MRVSDIPEIARMSTAEKILFLEDLWETIAVNVANTPLPESHRDELDRRYERHESVPGNLLSLDDLQARVENRK